MSDILRPPDLAAPPPAPSVRPMPADARMAGAAEAFEAAFLTEMFKHAGLGTAPEGFGGGAGEDQFAGFLREAQAREIAAAGGIGIAEYILRHMARTAE